MRIELVVAEVDIGVGRPDTEQQEYESRPPAEVEREPPGHHRAGPYAVPRRFLGT